MSDQPHRYTVTQMCFLAGAKHSQVNYLILRLNLRPVEIAGRVRIFDEGALARIFQRCDA